MSGRLLVDSRCRLDGEEPDKYTVEFAGPLKAKSLALVSSDVPFSALTISDGCDTLTFEDNGIVRQVQLKHKKLSTADEVVASLGSALNDTFPGRGIAVSKSADNKVVIQSPDAFRVHTKSASLARTLGLLPAPIRDLNTPRYVTSTPSGNGQNTTTFKRTPDLEPEPYLLLQTNVAGSIASPVPSADGALAALLPGKIDVAQLLPCKTSWPDFWRMTITIVRIDGTRYDFNGFDHRLEFIINAP